MIFLNIQYYMCIYIYTWNWRRKNWLWRVARVFSGSPQDPRHKSSVGPVLLSVKRLFEWIVHIGLDFMAKIFRLRGWLGTETKWQNNTCQIQHSKLHAFDIVCDTLMSFASGSCAKRESWWIEGSNKPYKCQQLLKLHMVSLSCGIM
jgi:hypothetical protein